MSATDRANAELNPFRYRGYYYDVETGYYYLQTRYYNPEWGRFLNADSALYGNMLGFNLFAYCYNNPVNYFDPTGESGIAAVLAGWASSAWGLMLVDGLLPVGDIVYVGGIIILSIVVVVDTAILADTIADIVQDETDISDQPNDLPEEKEIEVDIDHIMENHHPNNGKHPRKDKFPKWMAPPIIEEIVRRAYTDARNNAPESIIKVQRCFENGIEVTKYLIFGTDNGQKIEIWYNVTKKIIETAFPK